MYIIIFKKIWFLSVETVSQVCMKHISLYTLHTIGCFSNHSTQVSSIHTMYWKTQIKYNKNSEGL